MGDRRFYEGPVGSGIRRSAPAALRNRRPIANVLRDWLPAQGIVLEIASGTGEHAIHFAQAFPNLEWQPSDSDPQALASIAGWQVEAGLPNLRSPLVIDARDASWPIGHANAVLNINMVHISPWAASAGLVAGAARVLARKAPLILYGPWLGAGLETAPSNLAFDASLKERDPEWGLRNVEDFEALARVHGFDLVETRTMPANNLMLLFRLERPERT